MNAPRFVSTMTVRVVSINGEPHKHLIEGEPLLRAEDVRKSKKPMLCGRELVFRKRAAKKGGETEEEIDKGDRIRVGGLGTGTWCASCLAKAGKAVIAP